MTAERHHASPQKKDSAEGGGSEKQLPVLSPADIDELIAATGAIPKSIPAALRSKLLQSGYQPDQIKRMTPEQAHWIGWKRDAMVRELGKHIYKKMKGAMETSPENRKPDSKGETRQQLEEAISSFGQFEMRRKFSRDEALYPERGEDITWAQGQARDLKRQLDDLAAQLRAAGKNPEDIRDFVSLSQYLPRVEERIAEHQKEEVRNFKKRITNIAEAFTKRRQDLMATQLAGTPEAAAAAAPATTEPVAPAPHAVPATAAPATPEPGTPSTPEPARVERENQLGPPPAPIDLDAHLGSNPVDAARAINSDLDRFYSAWSERFILGNVFFNAAKRDLWKARHGANKFIDAYVADPNEANLAALRSHIDAINGMAPELEGIVQNNTSYLAGQYPDLYDKEATRAREAYENLPPEGRGTARRVLGYGSGLGALAALGILVAHHMGSEGPEGPPSGPVASSQATGNENSAAASQNATQAENGQTTQGNVAQAERSPAAQAPVAGAEARQESRAEVTLTTDELTRGKGADVLFYKMRERVRQQYGREGINAPPVAQLILRTNPHMLGRALGFSGTFQTSGGRVPASRIMHIGDKLVLTERGGLEFYDAYTRTNIPLIAASVGEVTQLHQVIPGPLRPDRQAQRVRVTYNQPIATTRAPETRTAPTPTTTTPLPSATEAAPASVQSQPASPAPVETTTAPEAPTASAAAPAPPAAPQPEAASTTGSDRAGSPSQRAPSQAVERAAEAASQPAQAPAESVGQASTNPGERVVGSPQMEQYRSQPAYAIFYGPSTVDRAFRQNMIDLLRRSGTGPNEGEPVGTYVERARAALAAGTPGPAVIVRTPNNLLVAHGGDPSARLIVGAEYLRLTVPQNPTASVIMEGLSNETRGYVMPAEYITGNATGVVRFPTVDELHLTVPVITNDMEIVY